MDIIKTARKFALGPKRALRDNDYFIDRLSHRHTTQILIVFIVISTFKRFYQAPITCWVPAELKRYEKFMNRYCWMQGAYYAEQSYDLNTLSIEARDETLLRYYQWVHVFLLFQAFLFYLPRIVWCLLSNKLLGYDLFNIIEAGMQYDKMGANQDHILKYISANFAHKYKYLPVKTACKADTLRTAIHQKDFRFEKHSYFTWFSTSILTMTYILMKFAYLVNALGQIYAMNAFLSSRAHSFYGKHLFNCNGYKHNRETLTCLFSTLFEPNLTI